MSSKLYDENFYRLQKEKSYDSAKIVLPILFELFSVKSCVDFGCGAGTWLKVAQDVLGGGTRILGLDFGENDASLMIPANHFLHMDLTGKIELGEKFDLVISLEVAEHLPKEAATTFVESLCRHGDVVLFSAAIPGQGGSGHVNEQWPSYWANLFEANGFCAVDILRPKFWHNDILPVWYRQNIMLYVSRKRKDLKPLLSGACSQMLDVVHPDLWNRRAVSVLFAKPFQMIAKVREAFLRRR